MRKADFLSAIILAMAAIACNKSDLTLHEDKNRAY